MDPACAEAGEDFAGVRDWQDAAAVAMAAGSPLAGLPRGMRVRSRGQREDRGRFGGDEPDDDEDEPESKVSWKSQLPSRQEIAMLVAFCLLCAIMFGLILMRSGEAERREAAPAACRQCKREWWQDFWKWRLQGLESKTAHLERPPPGMEWEWAESLNDTDWYGASAELVDVVVARYADPALGPLLHVGCGDSPMPELLHKAGFSNAVHMDIAPQIVDLLRQRYPASDWPGMDFVVRDFLAPSDAGGGPPPPLHRFAAVVDKAGIWDWLQDEAAGELPKLLDRVRDALIVGEQQAQQQQLGGVYIVVTKQAPVEFSETLAQAQAQFVVEASRPLGTKGIAWCYVLEPL